MSYSRIIDLSKLFYKTAIRSRDFKLEEFKQFTKPYDAIVYAEDKLEELGEGSSRVVYLFSSRLALKIAINEAGIAQNRLEKVISNDSDFNEIIAQVKESGPKDIWILSELAKPISVIFEYDYGQKEHDVVEEGEEFSKHSPVPWDTLTHGITNKQDANEMSALVNKMIEKYHLNEFDILTPSNWGRTADGRMVILDYGLDDWITKNRYG